MNAYLNNIKLPVKTFKIIFVGFIIVCVIKYYIQDETEKLKQCESFYEECLEEENYEKCGSPLSYITDAVNIKYLIYPLDHFHFIFLKHLLQHNRDLEKSSKLTSISNLININSFFFDFRL
jgi:hypothetical protein